MQRIMVATDFSNSAFEAAVLAARVASRHAATLSLFHAHPVAEPNAIAASGPAMTEALTEAGHLLTELATRVSESVRPGLTIETAAVAGEPVAAIVAHATRGDAQLIVMGSLGAGGATKHPEFGSVAAAVSRRAGCPVLVSRIDQALTVPGAGAFKKPTVVIDDVAFSHAAVALAAQLSEPESTIEVVHAILATADIEQSANVRNADMQRIAELAPRVDETTVAVTVTSGPSRFTDQLLDFVGKSSDVVIVGAAPEEAGGLLGPIADKMLQVSPVPVAIIPRPALTRDS